MCELRLVFLSLRHMKGRAQREREREVESKLVWFIFFLLKPHLLTAVTQDKRGLNGNKRGGGHIHVAMLLVVVVGISSGRTFRR